MAEKATLRRLYTGEGGLDFVGRRKTWYSITAVVLLICLGAIVIRGFTLGIDFQGGTKMNMPYQDGLDETQVSRTFADATGVEPEKVQIVGAGDSRILEINSKRLSEEQIGKAREEIYTEYQPENSEGEATPDVIGDSTVSESWGSTITSRMLLALGVFFVLIFAYITIRFERDMAIAAMAGIAVDGIVVSGVYALTGLEVTPATVIGLLTVLAFSLYDTVVVFDKVEENTAGFESSIRATYAEQANLAVNQTVMRSIVTTVISAIPIASLMVIAVWLMGVGTLKDLSIVQLIGVIEGTFSSVFLATPILVTLKNLQSKVKAHNAKVAAARAGTLVAEPVEEVAAPAEFTEPAVPASADYGKPVEGTGTWRPDRR
ncbi:protein translocase subunit SecF [Corynebacterium choanae]|uniref:Protein-export membrane protein SecF n=1 Tax=Corynebacterium choanae TaxID=1862358 RepID=A0A3G6J6J9_9CORY|nr:protein translocase subunit SecF [Corynebacterium choanae]AZA13697.1 preprotein translocase subunit SecF [Corynebacterium choanae]